MAGGIDPFLHSRRTNAIRTPKRSRSPWSAGNTHTLMIDHDCAVFWVACACGGSESADSVASVDQFIIIGVGSSDALFVLRRSRAKGGVTISMTLHDPFNTEPYDPGGGREGESTVIGRSTGRDRQGTANGFGSVGRRSTLRQCRDAS